MIRRPALVLVLLTGMNLLNYLDRLVLSSVLPRVEAELGVSKLVEGTLATVFLVGYFLTSPFFGMLADRGKRTGLIAVGVAVWSLATIASGMATGKWSLLAARAVVGVGEASYATIAPTIIDDIAPSKSKGRWLAIFFAASPIGSALGYFTGALVEPHHGWRAAMYVAGGPGLLLALACLLVAEPERQHLAPPKESVIASARALFPLRIFRRAAFGYAAFTFAIGGFAWWAPTFLFDTYGLPLGKANFLFGGVTVVAGAVGTVLGGFLGDRAARARSSGGAGGPGGGAATDRDAALGYLRVCAISCAIGAPLAAACFMTASWPRFFQLVGPCEIALFVSTSPINAAVLRSVPPERRASAMALTILVIHLFGDLWSPPLVGAIAGFAPMRAAMFLLPVAFAVAAAVWWLPERAARRAPAIP